jgi:hypothetical protein
MECIAVTVDKQVLDQPVQGCADKRFCNPGSGDQFVCRGLVFLRDKMIDQPVNVFVFHLYVFLSHENKDFA